MFLSLAHLKIFEKNQSSEHNDPPKLTNPAIDRSSMKFKQVYSFDTFIKLIDTVNTLEADRVTLREEVRRLQQEMSQLKKDR